MEASTPNETELALFEYSLWAVTKWCDLPQSNEVHEPKPLPGPGRSCVPLQGKLSMQENETESRKVFYFLEEFKAPNTFLLERPSQPQELNLQYIS